MVLLRYPTKNEKPFVLMAIQTNGYFFLHPMLLDTGADHTIFPADFAAYVGHRNSNPSVIRERVAGIGGNASAYIHSMSLSLVDPNEPLTDINTPNCIWRSTNETFRFIGGFSSQFGLLGRDIMTEWKRISFAPLSSRWMIEITI